MSDGRRAARSATHQRPLEHAKFSSMHAGVAAKHGHPIVPGTHAARVVLSRPPVREGSTEIVAVSEYVARDVAASLVVLLTLVAGGIDVALVGATVALVVLLDVLVAVTLFVDEKPLIAKLLVALTMFVAVDATATLVAVESVAFATLVVASANGAVVEFALVARVVVIVVLLVDSANEIQQRKTIEKKIIVERTISILNTRFARKNVDRFVSSSSTFFLVELFIARNKRIKRFITEEIHRQVRR